MVCSFSNSILPGILTFVEELWTLLNWCNPGGLGPLDVWNKTISKPLKLGQSHDATNRQLGTARKIAKQLVENLLPRMFLRRMKSLIAHQLPNKSDKVVFCPLTKLQAEAYENFLSSEQVELIKYSGEDCDCGSKLKRGYCCYIRDSSGKIWRELVFPCVQNAQKLCNHIGNYIPLNEEPPDKRNDKMEWLQRCLPNDWEKILRRTPMENYMDPELCGKWVVRSNHPSVLNESTDMHKKSLDTTKAPSILACKRRQSPYILL